jgi:hypothetical protein
VLDAELEQLREQMGLRDNQKAELLREITALAGWVVAQARAGRVVEARGPDGVEVLRHPAVETRGTLGRIVLTAEEADRLEALLDSDTSPSVEVLATLRRLSDPKRRPPKLRWPTR